MDSRRSADLTVSAADISRNFGEWQAKAMSEPVMITHHGRPRLVLASLEIFESRTGQALKDTAFPTSGENARDHAILNQLKDSVFTFDADLKVVDLNPAAELFVGIPRDAMIGHDLRDLMPATRRSIVWDYFSRVLRTGEPIDFKTKAVHRSHPTMRFQAFPCDDDKVGVIVSHLGASEEASLQLRRHRAIQSAVGAEGAISLIRLNSRGGIDAVDDTFTIMTGFSEKQAQSLQLADILALPDRLAFTRVLNAVIRDGVGKVVNATLLPRTADAIVIRFYLGVASEDAAPDEVAVTLINIAQLCAAPPSE